MSKHSPAHKCEIVPVVTLSPAWMCEDMLVMALAFLSQIRDVTTFSSNRF